MTSSLPAGYVARRPTLDDVEAIVELVNRSSVADTGLPLVSEEQVRAIWQLPIFDPATIGWIVAAPDRSLAGVVLHFALEPYTEVLGIGVVHPRHEGRGIGTWLLTCAEERAADYLALAPAGAPVTLQIQTWRANDRAAALLARHGYQLARVFQRMQIDFDPDHPQGPVALPDGITIRTFVRGQDERRAWQAAEESFEDHWSHQEIPLETWTQVFIEAQEQFDPRLWWLALDGDDVAGVALCDPSAPGQPEYGWVATLGVRRPWRGRGIAGALLATAFAEFQRRGMRGVSLGVDAESPTGANRLYERAGMRAVLDTAVYAKELRAAGGT
jgi:mycothiol synthase